MDSTDNSCLGPNPPRTLPTHLKTLVRSVQSLKLTEFQFRYTLFFTEHNLSQKLRIRSGADRGRESVAPLETQAFAKKRHTQGRLDAAYDAECKEYV